MPRADRSPRYLSAQGLRPRSETAPASLPDRPKLRARPPRGPRRILILSDREGGEIRAIMDEDWCHAVRTAAAAAVAMRVLARKDAAIMTMLGAGDTARAAVPVMAHAFRLKEIRVTSRSTTRGRPAGRWCRSATWSASAKRPRHR